MRFMFSLIVAVIVYPSLPTSADVRSRSNCENVRGRVHAQITGNSPACPIATIVGQVFDGTDNNGEINLSYNGQICVED